MAEYAGYFRIQVDKNGTPVDAAARQQAVDALAQGGATDLLVISHGWNNDMADARSLQNFFTGVRQLLMTNSSGPQRKFAVLAILWPSKKFTDEQLIPGGAASAISITTACCRRRSTAKGVFDNPNADTMLEQAKPLLRSLETTHQRRQPVRRSGARFARHHRGEHGGRV